MEIDWTRQKKYYDYRAYGPTYSEGEQVLVFFPTVGKGETKKSPFFARDPTLMWKLLTTEILASIMAERKKL